MQKFANNSVSLLTSLVDNTSTLMVVSDGSKFPLITASNYFLITLVGLDQNGNESAWEICKVTFRDGNELTVERGQEGTSAQSWAGGTRVELRLTAGSMVAPDDPRLSDAREWTGGVVSQAEAEGGTATTSRKWTAQRVFQGITAWWNASAHKTKLDGIQAGAQVNAVTSVASRTGAVTLGISDIANLQTTMDGKAASSHTHSYLPLTGGTVTGTVTVNGAINGMAVTQSTTDTTAGRLLQVGDFGVGSSQPPIISNINDHEIKPGFYQYNAGSGSTNGPELYGTVISAQATLNASNYGGWASQMFFGTVGGFYVRRNASAGSASWDPWERVLTQKSILGTVSQSGGVPTGRIIERGSNANGTYVRFADGTQICWIVEARNDTVGANGTVSVGAWTFPATFAAGATTAHMSINHSGCIVVSNANTTTTAMPDLYLRNVTASGITLSSINLMITAFGRWY